MISRLGSIALAVFAIACASDDKGEGGVDQENSYGPAAEPCGDIGTGYPGDDVCIKPPPADIGFQMHFGPKSYDQAEIDKFLLPAGDEGTFCVFMPTPNADEIFLNEFHTRMRPGSHHMLLYVVDGVAEADLLTTDIAGDCSLRGFSQRNLFGAQTAVMDVHDRVQGPENEGLAVRVPARQQGVIEVHFINTGTEPILMEGWANIIYTDPAKVKIIGDPIFFIGGYTPVADGQTVIQTMSTTLPDTAATQASGGVRLVLGTGHYHAHTTRFTATTIIGGQRQLLMEDYDYHDPALLAFDSETQNTPADPFTKSPGGRSGIVHFNPGDSIEWECEVTNTSAVMTDPAQHTGVTLSFGNRVYEAEMCNMFGMYAPTMGGAWGHFL
jgi:hypothetical protein